MTLVMLIIVVQALLPMKNEMMSTTCTTIVVHRRDVDGEPFLFSFTNILGKMPLLEAASGISPSMSIPTSQELSTETITPAFTMISPHFPNDFSMMAAIDGSAMLPTSACEYTPRGRSDTTM